MTANLTLEQACEMYRIMSKPNALVALYLVNHLGGAYISDLALAIETSSPHMVNLCILLHRAGVIKKESVPRSEGRIVRVTIDEAVQDIITPILSRLDGDINVKRAVENYNWFKRSKRLVSSKYGL